MKYETKKQSSQLEKLVSRVGLEPNREKVNTAR